MTAAEPAAAADAGRPACLVPAGAPILPHRPAAHHASLTGHATVMWGSRRFVANPQGCQPAFPLQPKSSNWH